MKLASTFTRRVRTSRRLVFENIMDLEHVCVVHRRWFAHLRVRTWRADFVDYRLRARFHGLSQDIAVRGARVDENAYWYEFNGPLARIRVDGRLAGPDGDLVLSETITYAFPGPLLPAFLVARPLLRRQKEDILRDDTRLLERAYELEASGFRRSVDRSRPSVVVFGGTGFFGRLVVRDLLEHTDALVRVASRDPAALDFRPHETRVRAWIADLGDPGSVRDLVRGADACVSCVGPFQGLPLKVLEACLAERVPYVDVADDRDFVERASALDVALREADVPAFVGCSVVPGITALLTRMALARTETADQVRIAITPGTRHVRGPGSFACLLATVGETYLAPQDGRPRAVTGWTQRRLVDFPPDVGRRSAYRVVDIADHSTLPRWFGTRTVEFRIGSEFHALNRLLALYRASKRVLPGVATRALARPARALIAAVGWLGTTRGGVLVEVSGRGGTATLCVHRASDAQVIPAILPALAVERLLAGERPEPGIVPLHGWIAPERFVAALRARGVEVSERGADGAWRPWAAPFAEVTAGSAPTPAASARGTPSSRTSGSGSPR